MYSKVLKYLHFFFKGLQISSNDFKRLQMSSNDFKCLKNILQVSHRLLNLIVFICSYMAEKSFIEFECNNVTKLLKYTDVLKTVTEPKIRSTFSKIVTSKARQASMLKRRSPHSFGAPTQNESSATHVISYPGALIKHLVLLTDM